MTMRRYLVYGSIGIAAFVFLVVVSASPAISQVVTPPSESQGVRISSKAAAASFLKGEVMSMDLTLSNIGNKPFQTANLMIGFDVLKDDQKVYEYRMIREYPEQAPFTLQPGDVRTYTLSWPLKVMANATSTVDADAGTYTVRTGMFAPFELSTDACRRRGIVQVCKSDRVSTHAGVLQNILQLILSLGLSKPSFSIVFLTDCSP